MEGGGSSDFLQHTIRHMDCIKIQNFSLRICHAFLDLIYRKPFTHFCLVISPLPLLDSFNRVSSLWKNHGNLENEKQNFQILVEAPKTWKNHGNHGNPALSTFPGSRR